MTHRPENFQPSLFEAERSLPVELGIRQKSEFATIIEVLLREPRLDNYFSPITIESAATSGSTRVFENPTSRIQA